MQFVLQPCHILLARRVKKLSRTRSRTQHGSSAIASLRTPKTGHGAVAESASNPGEQEPESRPDNADFSAAVIAIMALPLTDDEKAETLRRLLASEK